ncbi:MAG: hypothetical protein KF680_06340 [Cryobacterium sp.]|nr:hypothetical protein [Cryobacterium sp.]
MTVEAPDRRRVVVLSDERRVDLAIPPDETLGSVLRGLGVAFENGSHAIVDRSGAQVDAALTASQLEDGALYSVVDLGAHLPRAEHATDEVTARPHRQTAWWALTVAGVIASVIAVATTDRTQIDTGQLIAALVLAAAAVGCSLLRTRHASPPTAHDTAVLAAPLSLAFAAGTLAVSATPAGTVHLAVTSGLLATGVLSALHTAMARDDRYSAATATITALALTLATIWGITLLANATPAAAAALSAGIVPVALRYVPTTLVNVADGHHIDFKHFMSSRWTVRGTIPETIDRVDTAEVRDIVETSTAKLATGIVALSATAALFYPFAPPPRGHVDVFVTLGAVLLPLCLVLALVLAARHYVSAPLRWATRASAAVIVLHTIITISGDLGDIVVLATAGGLLILSLVTVYVLTLIARGAASLIWSRVADGTELLAIALSIPAALLAGDVLTILRGVMA